MSSSSKDLLHQMRLDALNIFQASLKPVNPYEAVKRFVSIEGNTLLLGREGQEQTKFNLEEFERIFLVGGGKATAPMAKAMEDLLGDRITSGIINVKYAVTFIRFLVSQSVVQFDSILQLVKPVNNLPFPIILLSLYEIHAPS